MQISKLKSMHSIFDRLHAFRTDDCILKLIARPAFKSLFLNFILLEFVGYSLNSK